VIAWSCVQQPTIQLLCLGQITVEVRPHGAIEQLLLFPASSHDPLLLFREEMYIVPPGARRCTTRELP